MLAFRSVQQSNHLRQFHMYLVAPVRAKRLVALAEGTGHGWELLGGAAGSDWSPLAGTVAAWIQGRHR
jgi:hypothetical protein